MWIFSNYIFFDEFDAFRLQVETDFIDFTV